MNCRSKLLITWGFGCSNTNVKVINYPKKVKTQFITELQFYTLFSDGFHGVKLTLKDKYCTVVSIEHSDNQIYQMNWKLGVMSGRVIIKPRTLKQQINKTKHTQQWQENYVKQTNKGQNDIIKISVHLWLNIRAPARVYGELINTWRIREKLSFWRERNQYLPTSK